MKCRGEVVTDIRSEKDVLKVHDRRSHVHLEVKLNMKSP